jgi:hypothetical protein
MGWGSLLAAPANRMVADVFILYCVFESSEQRTEGKLLGTKVWAGALFQARADAMVSRDND